MIRSHIYKKVVSVLFLSILMGCSSTSAPPKVLQVGDKAEPFSLMDSTGHWVKLTDVQAGSYLVLIFYRGSWCETCENWLLDLKKAFPQFASAHASLAAVSVDSVEDSATFNQQWRFPFPLLSDPGFHLIDAYGLRDPKKGHHGEDISHVAVVVVDPQGTVRYRYEGKEAWNHPVPDEIIDVIKKLQSGTPVPIPGDSL